MANSYSALGRWFEYLNDDCDYGQWSQYLIDLVKTRASGLSGLDIGCGNGYFTRAFIREGFSVRGVDISPQMLDTAKTLALKEGVKAEFLLGDITKLTINGKVDFCIAVNDCINYVPKDKLTKAFSHVYNCLKKGGVFIFDISSSEKLKTVVGNNVFAEDRDDISYMWFNSVEGDKVIMDLTFFEKGKDNNYNRFDERHIQYIYEEDEILSALKASGFSAESAGHLGKDKKDRINFICIRL